MKRYYLTRLRIEGFRGINNDGAPLDLRFATDKVNSIYAVNGLGKSSIYDALSYAIRGAIPKLEALQQSEDAQLYYCNRFHPQFKATIQLTLQADDHGSLVEITVERDHAGTRTVTSPTGHTDPEALLKSLNSDFTLLDQATFEQFIRSTPLDRGRAFSRLLGLSQLTQYRAALQSLANRGNLRRDFAVDGLEVTKVQLTGQLQQCELRLRTAYDQLTGVPYSGVLDAAVITAGVIAALNQIQLISSLCNVKTLAELDFAAIHTAIAQAEKSKDREKLIALQTTLSRLQRLAPAPTEATDQETLRQVIAEHDAAMRATAGPLLLENYRSALAVVTDQSWDDPKRCPTCETVLPASITDALNAKLAAYTRADEAAKRIRTLWQAATWATKLRDLEADPTLAIAADQKSHAPLQQVFAAGQPTMAHLTAAIQALSHAETTRQKTVESTQTEITQLQQALPPSIVTVTQQVATAKNIVRDLADHQKLTPQLSKVDRQLKRRAAWEAFINNALRDFAAAEAKWVDNRQHAISADYQQMHEDITRNPDVVPSLDRSATMEKLHLKLDRFYGLTGLSANTLLQESYCNSIAISIFLSAALQCPSTARFMVLDDITSSFDAGHQWNLMELLRNRISPPTNPDGPQLILLTHDTLLEKYLDKATATTSGWRHHKLLGTPPAGPVLTEQHDADHVRKRAEYYLNAGQLDAAKPWIRQYLESVLSQIIRKVAISVPVDYAMSDSRKQVQNALDAIAQQLELVQQAGRLVLTTQQALDAGQSLVPTLVGNWCAHYATASTAGVTSHVLLGVLDDVDKLADCFKYDCNCQSAGTTNRRFYRDLTRKACSC